MTPSETPASLAEEYAFANCADIDCNGEQVQDQWTYECHRLGFLAGHAAGRESARELADALRAIYPALSNIPDYRKIVDEALTRFKALAGVEK